MSIASGHCVDDRGNRPSDFFTIGSPIVYSVANAIGVSGYKYFQQLRTTPMSFTIRWATTSRRQHWT